MSPEDVNPEWVEKARAAIVAKADADDALDDAGKLSDDEWDRALSTSHSINGVARRVDGDPEVFARTVLAAEQRNLGAQYTEQRMGVLERTIEGFAARLREGSES